MRKSTLPHVTWLRAFDSAARTGSFSAAAEDLNLTPAAISQQIKLLEQHLGVQLFSRLPRGVELTDIGHAYALPIRKSFSDLQDATSGLFGYHQKPTVRVRASISYATLILAPQLSAFRQLHPNIDIQLTTAVWTDRTEDDAPDVEIRYGHGDWPEPNLRHLGHQSAEIVCHPALAASLGDGLSAKALVPHAVQIIGSESDWSQLSDQYGLDLPPVPGMMKADSSLVALSIISGGVGAAITPVDFSRRYVEQGVLMSPFDYSLPLTRGFFIVTQNEAAARREVTLFCDWLAGLSAQ